MRNTLFLALAILIASACAAETAVTRTQTEVERLIETDGSTPPPWLAAVKLNYPPTLGVHWEKPKEKEPWTPSKYLGQFIWSTINENPGRWREGLKVLYHVYDLNKDDEEKSKQSMKA